MPILVASFKPPVVRTSPTVFAEQLTLVLSRGSEVWPLDEAHGMKVLLGAQGLDAPTLNAQSRTPAGWDGEVIDSISAEPREVFLPIRFRGGRLTELQDLKRRFLSFLNPARGAVTLSASLPDGSTRLIDGVYLRGLDGAWDDGTFYGSRQKAGIVLRCANPFWREPDPWDADWVVEADSGAPLPILPVAPGASRALGTPQRVTVPGDVETFAVWKITGPLAGVTISDDGAGRSLTFTRTLNEGETWTIDTRRGKQGVFDPTGARARATLNRGAQFWPLRPGTSLVTAAVVGASPGASVSASADVLWLTA